MVKMDISNIFCFILWVSSTWRNSLTSTLPSYSNLTMTMDVPFGKSVKLDFTDILRYVDISANSNETIRNDRCQIRVLDKESIYSKVGFVSTRNFPCNAENATYSHLGFESPDEDIVKFRLEYYTKTDFVDYTLFLILKIRQRDETTFVQKGLPLRISEKSTESRSLPIVRKAVIFHDEDFSLDFCTVEIIEYIFFPLYGKITKNGVVLLSDTKFDCHEFFNGDLRYELTAEVFSSADILIFKINYFLGEDLDEAGNMSAWQSEYFQMPVQIEHGTTNSPPEIDFTATLLLDVSNFVIRSVTREVLLAKDVDGASSAQLRYQVTQAPELSDGFLIRLDDPIHPIDSFTQKDVDTGKIAFRPPLSNTQTDSLLEIVLEITDPQELNSQPVPLMIVVHPTSYYAPFVVINTGLTLYEGEATTLWSTTNLAVADEDNLDEVDIRVVSGLAHGRLLLRGDSVKQFVPGDLQTGALRYQHDGSDSSLDSMVLQMDDGQHKVDFLLPITIRPVDDQPPVLLTNTGILVHTNKQIVNITSKILKAKDRDSESSLIRYVLKSALSFGRFLLTDETLVLSNAAIVTEWTQGDINAGHLFYQHDDAHSNGRITWHTVEFILEDNNAPLPNLSPHLQTVTITVIPLDTLPPHLSSAASMRLHVNASQVAIIGNGILHFVDDRTSDKDLSLIVHTGPQFGRLIWMSTFGGRNWPAAQAGSDDAYDINLIERQIPEQFPQSALAYGDIAYQADNVLEDARDKIIFNVRDKQGNSLKEQVLHIFLHPLSDASHQSNLQEIRPKSRRFSQQPPAVLTRPVIVKEGATATINDDYLLISPSDQPLAAITLRLDSTPQRGTLSLQNKTLVPHDHFPATHISNGDLLYHQNNSVNPQSSLEDHIIFSLSDKVSKESILAELHIRIIPQPSTKAPRKLGLTKLGLVIQVKQNTPYYFTPNIFLGSTNAYPPSDLIFHIEKSPQSGSICLNHNETSSFTWKNIVDGLVSYKARRDPKTDLAENTLLDDEVSFRVESPTTEWIMNDRIIDHLQIQILLVPGNPVTSVGKSFVVGESGTALLSEEHLVIVAPPYQRVNCSLVIQPFHGHLNDVARNTTVMRFSNYELLEHRIYYHQNHHKMVEPRLDSIRLNCAGAWIELPVTILPTNDEAPVINTNHLQVATGEQVLLGAFVSISDADIPSSSISINITGFPQHGIIVGHTTDIDPNEILIEPAFHPLRNFTVDDLLLPDKVFYRHDGSRTFSDNFRINVSDGVNNVEKDVYVIIHDNDNGPSEDDPQHGLTEYITAPFELVGTPHETVLFNTTKPQLPLNSTFGKPIVRDLMPNITFNTPNKALVLLPNKHLGIKLTTNILTVYRDTSSTEKELLFEVVEQPKYGHFVDLHKAERHIRVFTEDLVNISDVAYALDMDKEFATEDSFKFRAINELGMKSQVIEGKLNWSWISFTRDRYETNEMMGIVKVGLRRRGNLTNRDFVAVKARDLTTVMGRDYKENYALQAEFQPGQNETFVEIRILKDDLFEDREYFQLVLEEPQFANVEKPFVVTITISDQDDGALVYIPHPLYTVPEYVGIFNLTLKRSGKDLSQSVSVICFTTDGTASGTVSHHLQIFRPDFGTRLNIHSSVVTFGPHEITKTCPIVIVNDDLAENDETFYVNIRALGSGSRVGVYQQTEIVIRRDLEDEPSVSFAKAEYSTSIFDPFVEVQVERKGGDLSQPSEVDIISEQGKRIEVVYFGPGESTQNAALKRLGDFNVTGDMFRVFLNNSLYSKIPQPNSATVYVKKSMNFTVVSTLGESETPITDNEIVLLSNYGSAVEPSLLPDSKARYECINCDKNKIPLDKIKFSSIEHHESRASSLDEILAADVPDRRSSYGPFYREEREKTDKKGKVEDWKDGMIDTAPNGRSTLQRRIPIVRGGVITKQGSANSERSRSASTISFAKAHYDITEPSSLHHMHWVSIPLIRYGNLSKSDTVRVITKDGSAKSGQDFEAVDTIVNFEPNRSQEVLQVRIIFDEAREASENFTVHLYSLRRTVAELRISMTVVTIKEQSGENVRFPGAPIVVSLSNYDSPAPGGWVPIGQPLICITTCNSRHPDFQRTRRVCEIEGIDDVRTTYSWKISQPQDETLTLEPLQHIRSTAWFASIYEKVLDSIYFSNGSIIQCSARAVTTAGMGGYESISEIVTSVSMKPQCPSRGPSSSVTVDPFQASISNMKNGDVKITVIIPHRIGLVPLISTAAITDLHLMLGAEGTRTAEHLCSNMMTEQELRSVRNGFLKLKAGRQADSRHPLEILRGPKTQEFYRHLDLKNCLWTFEAIYPMTEILNVCGGKLIADAKSQLSSKREVTIQLPLYVTYAYFTNAVGTPWKHYEQSTTLDIVISYDNVLTWSPDYSTMPLLPPSMESESSLALTGPVSPRTVIHLQSAKTAQRTPTTTGATTLPLRRHRITTTSAPIPLTSNDNLPFPAELKVIQARVVDDGHHMNVRFKTKPKFRGKYLLDNVRGRTGSPVAKIILTSSPKTAFELQLLKTQENNASPQQLWRFRSVRANQISYGGTYDITLLPCEFDAGSLTTCKIRDPVIFSIHLAV